MIHQADNQTRGKTEIGVLYGFRALMVLFVCNYHIWQIGWLEQYATLFGQTLDFDFWTRSGYLFVDGMLLLSGFLLYLPYARQTALGTPVPGVKRFYWNRLERIAPSYLFSVAVMLFLFALPSGAYRNVAARNLDVLTHLTFTFTFFRETYLFTPLNGVLWTVAIEMQFYLIFPWLAKAAQKKPVLTLCAMIAAGIAFRLIVSHSVTDLAIWVNQLPAFLDVYALGMGTKPEPELLRDIQVAYYTEEEVRAVYFASPDLETITSAPLAFEKGEDAQGRYIRFTVPSLQYWDMIFLRGKAHE